MHNAGPARSTEVKHLCSGQFALAANAKVFLCLHQRHSEQMGEQIQLVASGQLGEHWQALGDKCDGLFRTAIANQIICSRSPVPSGRRTFHNAQGLFQTNVSELANFN
jgi:hypothetical protein